jgi:hypothetical protein
MNEWTEEIEDILERVRKNSVSLSNRHRENYYEYKQASKWFDVPIIVVSTISASFSVGATSYMTQNIVSTITCAISMSITILSGIKLYLNLDYTIKSEYELSKNFNLLSLDIFKILHLKREQREIDGIDYLNTIYNKYTHLIEQSNLLRKRIKHDEMIELDEKKYFSDIDSNSSFNSQKGTEV